MANRLRNAAAGFGQGLALLGAAQYQRSLEMEKARAIAEYEAMIKAQTSQLDFERDQALQRERLEAQERIADREIKAREIDAQSDRSLRERQLAETRRSNISREQQARIEAEMNAALKREGLENRAKEFVPIVGGGRIVGIRNTNTGEIKPFQVQNEFGQTSTATIPVSAVQPQAETGNDAFSGVVRNAVGPAAAVTVTSESEVAKLPKGARFIYRGRTYVKN